MKKVIVIGAGTAGLASAIRLQSMGFQVEIFEKNHHIGGRMNQWIEKGYHFDMGPTIVMLPEIYKDVFRAAGKNPDDYLSFSLLKPMQELHYRDGTTLTIQPTIPSFVAELEKFGGKDATGYLRYLGDIYGKYQIVKDFLEESYRSPMQFFNPKTLFKLLKLRTLNSAYTSISKYVKDEHLRMALSFQTLYIGVSPFTGPSIYTIIPMIELLYGVWYIKGGMYAMIRAMERLFVELGGVIHVDSEVGEIVTEGKHATSIKVNGETHNADIILCNADFAYAIPKLIKSHKLQGKFTQARMAKKEYSASSFMLYLGLDKKYDLPVHQIRFTANFKKNIQQLFDFELPHDPSFYIYSPSQVDDSLAPEGHEVIYVLVPVPSSHQGNLSWNEDITKVFRDQLLEMLIKVPGLEDMTNHIDFIKTFTPSDWGKTFNLPYDATFGLRPTMSQSLYFRPQPKFKTIDNLYVTGTSVHPGAGVPIVLMSAKLAVEEIIKDHGKG